MKKCSEPLNLGNYPHKQTKNLESSGFASGHVVSVEQNKNSNEQKLLEFLLVTNWTIGSVPKRNSANYSKKKKITKMI